LKIGMVSEFYYPQPGGVSEHIRALSHELGLMGHEVVVLTSRIQGAVPESGPEVIRFGRSIPLRYNGSLSRLTLAWDVRRRFRRTLGDEAFDLLHLHNPLMPSLPLLALQEARCPMVGTFHSAFPRDRLVELFRRPLERLIDRLDARIAVSLSAERTVGELFPAEYRIIPNGVDCDLFTGGRAGSSRRRRTGERNIRHILFVGAMVQRKGLPHLIEAFMRLRQRRRDVDLWVVGDGPDSRRIRRLVPDRLRRHVRFFGFVPRHALVRFYAEADVFCAPSLGQESFGMVLLEAMAAGLPVVASDIDGYRDVLTHGREGLLLPPRDPKVLASTLESLLNSPEELAQFGRNGRATAAGLHWKEIARRVDAVYRESLGLPEETIRAAHRCPAGSNLTPQTSKG
jgi:phosphatidyl-myo-inositol alpha-mannosyltransferase